MPIEKGALMGTRMRFTSKRVAIIVGTSLLVGGGVAYGSIPDANKVFTGCMLNKVGTVRLIDTSLPDSNPMSHCVSAAETPITWNQKGQPGPTGPPGAQGQPGSPGKDGTNGTNGADGKDGTSVINDAELPGTNCANGGSRFTAGGGAPTFACNGKDGKDGTNGTDGKDGTNGTNGQDGVSVTSAAEPAGENCANGGSKFTAANGVTFACNGTDGGSGSAQVRAIGGEFDFVPPTFAFVFFGTPADVTISGPGTHDVGAMATATLAPGPFVATFRMSYALCTQEQGGAITPMGGPILVNIDAHPGVIEFHDYAASGSVSEPAGTYKVGFCASTLSSVDSGRVIGLVIEGG